MSTHITTDPTTVPAATPTAAPGRLHLVRGAVAIVWAGLLVLTASELGVAAGVLLVLYPLVDVTAAVVESRWSGVRPVLPTIVISSLAAVGLAVAATSGIPAVLRVWGVWAILAGLVQLVVTLRRGRVAGRLALVLSGAISAVAGVAFVATAAQDDPSLTSLAGYAVLGGLFFLVSGVRLGRTARTA